MVTTTKGREGSGNVERRIEGGVVTLRDGDSVARVEVLSPNVVLSVLEGRHTEAIAHAMTAEIEAVMSRLGPIHNFYDGWAQDGHDPAIRNHWQTFATNQKSRLLSTQMLYRPKNSIATMATTVANLVLGGSLTIHTSQTAFRTALDVAREGRGTRS